jgi:hypothetical protein
MICWAKRKIWIVLILKPRIGYSLWHLHKDDPLHELEGREPNTGIDVWLRNKSQDFRFACGQHIPGRRVITIGTKRTEEKGIDSSETLYDDLDSRGIVIIEEVGKDIQSLRR